MSRWGQNLGVFAREVIFEASVSRGAETSTASTYAVKSAITI